jgi:hypothetical protein
MKVINYKDIFNLRKIESPYQGHTCRINTPWIEASTGSLGQRFSFAIGQALTLKYLRKRGKVHSIIGDGELQEGQIWEGVMFAAQHKLDNFVAILDYNKLQSDNFNTKIMNIEPLKSKIISFNWNVLEIDGHSFYEIERARRKGFKTIVLSSHLIHLGTSTKLKKDPLLSSNSWLIEKDMWSEISLKFLNDAPISNKLNSRFSTQFIDLIKNSKKLLIYGCGTISNYVSKNFITDKEKVDYASALSEEIGQKFNDKTIKDLKKINFFDYDKIFISAIGYERKIIDKIPEEIRYKIITLKKSVKKNNINFEISNHRSLFYC